MKIQRPSACELPLCVWEDYGADPHAHKTQEIMQGNQNGITKGKSYMTNLVSFLWWVMTMVNKRRLKDILYIDFCKSFSTIPDDILISEFEIHGFDEWNIQQIRNWKGWRRCRLVEAGDGPLRALCCDWYSLIFLSVSQTRDQVHTQQVCRGQEAEWCSWHNRRRG